MRADRRHAAPRREPAPRPSYELDPRRWRLLDPRRWRLLDPRRWLGPTSIVREWFPARPAAIPGPFRPPGLWSWHPSSPAPLPPGWLHPRAPVPAPSRIWVRFARASAGPATEPGIAPIAHIRPSLLEEPACGAGRGCRETAWPAQSGGPRPDPSPAQIFQSGCAIPPQNA